MVHLIQLLTMSLQVFSRILRPLGATTSRQSLRSVAGYTQAKTETSKEEWGTLVLGLGLLSTAIVWVRFRIRIQCVVN